MDWKTSMWKLVQFTGGTAVYGGGFPNLAVMASSMYSMSLRKSDVFTIIRRFRSFYSFERNGRMYECWCLGKIGRLSGVASCSSPVWVSHHNQWVELAMRHPLHGLHSSVHVKQADSIGIRLLKLIGRLGGFNSSHQVLMRSVKQLYESCVDNIEYESFFSVCSLPNTLQSWFLVTQLHIWLCVVQLDRLETKDAKTAKRILAGIFWDDVDERIKALGIGSGRNLTRGKRELVSQFYGLCYAYEEGLRLLPDRTKLQSSLLRNLTCNEAQDSPIVGKILVDYVVTQLDALGQTSVHELRNTGVVNWRLLKLKTAENHQPL